MEHFKESEFDCKCGCGLGFNQMQMSTVEKLVNARYIAKMPFKITSAVRCRDHNTAEGGKDYSSHLSGSAVDISCYLSGERSILVSALLDAGFTRIGIAKTFIHADDDESKPETVIWLYS